MVETRRKFDTDFRECTVRLVRQTGKPIAQVAQDLGINEGTFGDWVNADARQREGADGALREGAARTRCRTAHSPGYQLPPLLSILRVCGFARPVPAAWSRSGRRRPGGALLGLKTIGLTLVGSGKRPVTVP
jgi:transposase-like protein